MSVDVSLRSEKRISVHCTEVEFTIFSVWWIHSTKVAIVNPSEGKLVNPNFVYYAKSLS
jgi:hypothetical protein